MAQVKFNRKARKDKDHLTLHQDRKLFWLSSPLLDEQSWVVNGFSTRLGGVSQGDVGTMNLGFSREENTENVRENYARIARALGVDREKMVCSAQTHTTNVRSVTAEDAGCGVKRRPVPWHDVDALVTDVPGITLTIFMADCVPLLIADPVHHAVGAAHSGWRGTIGNIAQKTLDEMNRCYGTRSEEVYCAIGPSICGDCYEVSADVAKPFLDAYPDDGKMSVCREKGEGKYLLDLWEACRKNFVRAGVSDDAISLPDICTHCNSDLLFSHRTLHGRQGSLGAFIGVRE